MIKKILILLTIITLGGAGFIYIKYKNTIATVYPYPYFVKYELPKEVNEIENADVLIVGDALGVSLNRFLPEIISTLSKNLRTELKIYNWSESEAALHRTLIKLRKLKKTPPIVIYIGSTQEFLEKRLMVADRKVYDANLALFEDERFSSAIMSFPILSKFIYQKPSKYFILDDKVVPFNRAKTSFISQTRAEYIYKYYQLQLKQLTSLMRERGSTLIAVTTPINLEVAPRLVCDNAETNTIMIEQNDIEKLLKSGKSKEALKRSKALVANSTGNARTYYQLGRAYLLEGDLSKAKENLSLASAFDCENWRSNPIFNKILTKHFQENGHRIIDFANIVESGLGRDITFKDDIYAQDVYYQKLSKEFISTIKTILKI
ncbi:hypothetical protein [Halobacteriovorax sp. HLS]|uniref:hypothetical protein n=1 Tax=Halobacteriovorax sp. HLS TaxID=2234000 RepID=UPI000FD83A57|nr:hypothetical protein [Halobacteriovorax sp. HLS]